MLLQNRSLALILLLLGAGSSLAHGATITLNFEGLIDGTQIASTYAVQGATFTNAAAITAGISLNEAEFPAHSGVSVATDTGGPITIAFANPIYSFSAYFTYASALQVSAVDSSNNQIAILMSAVEQNFTSSGNSPNEFIQLSYSQGFSFVTIAGDPAGGSFVMDDVTFQTSLPVNGNAPEPAAVFLVMTGLLVVGAVSRRLTRVVLN